MTKSREVPTVFAAKGFEKGTRDMMVETYERLAAVEQQVAELAIMQLQIIKSLEQVVDGAGGMRKQIERMQGRPDDDDLPDVAN